MNINQALLSGARAFLNGKPRAPAQNGQFMEALFREDPERKCSTAELLQAFLTGWDRASLGHDAPPDFPSALAFRRIMAFAEDGTAPMSFLEYRIHSADRGFYFQHNGFTSQLYPTFDEAVEAAGKDAALTEEGRQVLRV